MGVIKQSGFMVYHTSTSLTSPAGDKKCGLLQSDLVRLWKNMAMARKVGLVQPVKKNATIILVLWPVDLL